MLINILLLIIIVLVIFDICFTITNSNDLEEIKTKANIILDGIYPNERR